MKPAERAISEMRIVFHVVHSMELYGLIENNKFKGFFHYIRSEKCNYFSASSCIQLCYLGKFSSMSGCPAYPLARMLNRLRRNLQASIMIVSVPCIRKKCYCEQKEVHSSQMILNMFLVWSPLKFLKIRLYY